jgi:hypothetical protein
MVPVVGFIFALILGVIAAVEDPGIVVINLGRSSFKGTEGALTKNDALVLKAMVESKCRGNLELFTYAEVGSYLGLSATIVADACPNSLIYCHDLFPMSEETLSEASAPPPEASNLLVKFWSGIKRNKLQNQIIPMRGKSEDTLLVHDDASLDVAFVDGDHSYEGALVDLRLMWNKLKSGGLLLCHDAVVLENGTNHFVRQAVIDFSKEIGVKFFDIEGTWGIVAMTKEGGHRVGDEGGLKWS